jgi:hypothetical protein
MLLLFIYAASSDAAELICNGKVDILSYHSPNNLMIKLSSMNQAVFFCSPDIEWKVAGTQYVTGPETCKTLYSTFLAIKMSEKSIARMHFDGDQVPNDCNGWGGWQKANIRYFQIQ